jgi:hypothetical protein
MEEAIVREVANQAERVERRIVGEAVQAHAAGAHSVDLWDTAVAVASEGYLAVFTRKAIFCYSVLTASVPS